MKQVNGGYTRQINKPTPEALAIKYSQEYPEEYGRLMIQMKRTSKIGRLGGLARASKESEGMSGDPR